MIGWLLQHVQLIRKALRGRSESPRQLAVAVALGLLLGLIPKGNLIAAVVTVCILGSTANAGAALLTATIVSFAAVLVDPLSHRIGLSILTHESLYPFWHALYQWPVVPWTNFNHTVVIGGLIVGLVLFYPAYRLSYLFFDRNNAKRTNETEKPEADDALTPDARAKETIATPEETIEAKPEADDILKAEAQAKETIEVKPEADDILKPNAQAKELIEAKPEADQILKRGADDSAQPDPDDKLQPEAPAKKDAIAA